MCEHWALKGLWGGKFQGDKIKSLSFERWGEKALQKLEYLRNPPACWSNVVCIDTTASCAAWESKWRWRYNYIAPLHLASFNIDKQNPLLMFHWFYLPNITWENINLMGANTYPVIPLEVTQREEELYILYLICFIEYPLDSGMESVVFLPSFLFFCPWLILKASSFARKHQLLIFPHISNTF